MREKNQSIGCLSQSKISPRICGFLTLFNTIYRYTKTSESCSAWCDGLHASGHSPASTCPNGSGPLTLMTSRHGTRRQRSVSVYKTPRTPSSVSAMHSAMRAHLTRIPATRTHTCNTHAHFLMRAIPLSTCQLQRAPGRLDVAEFRSDGTVQPQHENSTTHTP